MTTSPTEELLAEYFELGSTKTPAESITPDVFAIDFERRDGNHFSLSYNNLLWVYFNPSVGLRLQFATHCVVVEGSRLETLFNAAISRRLTRVVEESERLAEVDLDRPFVTRLVAMQNQPKGDPFPLPVGVEVQGSPANG